MTRGEMWTKTEENKAETWRDDTNYCSCINTADLKQRTVENTHSSSSLVRLMNATCPGHSLL